MKPLHLYYKPNYVWILKTKTNVFITDLDDNDFFKYTKLYNAVYKILENEINSMYLTITQYYNKK